MYSFSEFGTGMLRRTILSCQEGHYKQKKCCCAPTTLQRGSGDPGDVGVSMSQIRCREQRADDTHIGLTGEKSSKGSVYRGMGRVEGNPGQQAVL